MFGHDDQSQHHDNNQPSPDGALADDQTVGPPPVDDTAGDYIEATPTTLPAPAQPADSSAVAAPAGQPNTDHLLDIKQQALQQLTPLIGHLEQSPEEKFRTTMMMIQASDNDSLVKAAYDAALQIPDEKVRAQALLDIVNEINYFTHNNSSEEA
ncbi:MAG: hypothetical protein AAB834_00925 [Patescibacteria group bacterium]